MWGFCGDVIFWIRRKLFMVRPERFELPTLWFEAKCSIQLSYGRMVAIPILQGGRCCTDVRRGLGDGGLHRSRWRGVLRFGDEGDGFDDIEAGAAEQLVDDGAGEAAGVVLHADSPGGLVDSHPADAIDIADLGEREDGVLGRWRTVAIENVKLSHR
jgi:hypothetical protein